MLGRNRALRAGCTADHSRPDPRCQSGIQATERSRESTWNVALALGMGLALLTASCVRLRYDETQTIAPDATPSAASTPVAATVTSQAARLRSTPQGESPTPAPVISGPTVLRVDPSVVNLAVSETNLVQVWLDNVEQLHSIELQIDFEPRYVHVADADPDAEGVQIGAGVLPMSAQVTQNGADNNAGTIVYEVTQAPGETASGSGMVASFVVQGLAEGGSPLRFSMVEIRDSDGELLATPKQVDGLVVVGSGGTPEQTVAPRPTVPASPAPAGDVYHTVQPGENLFRIALHYGTTVEAIVAANHLPDQHSVHAGQKLLIPIESRSDSDTYVVQPGDTLYSIARRFDTTVETLAALNGIAPPYTIEVGQALIVAP